MAGLRGSLIKKGDYATVLCEQKLGRILWDCRFRAVKRSAADRGWRGIKSGLCSKLRISFGISCMEANAKVVEKTNNPPRTPLSGNDLVALGVDSVVPNA
jgi:hypothetical protein